MATSIYQALRKRFRPPEWGILFEVANKTGFRSQSADALAMSLWPSRGLSLHGIEIKEHRGDWLRELRNPAKSEKIQAYCDYWWIAAPKGVLKLEELPETWGYLEHQGARMVCKREAPKLAPTAMDRPFLAAIVRRCAEAQLQWVPRAEISEELQAARNEGREQGEAGRDYEKKRLVNNLESLQKNIKAFEDAAGIKIDLYHAGKCGKQFRAAQNLEGLRESFRTIAYARNNLESILSKINEVSKLLQENEES